MTKRTQHSLFVPSTPTSNSSHFVDTSTPGMVCWSVGHFITLRGKAMTLLSLIQQRVDEGWEFQTGQHIDGLSGFWAAFVQNDPSDSLCCSECDEPITARWEESGHGLNLGVAIRMADAIAQGVTILVPDGSKFRGARHRSKRGIHE